jgi:hypothetical protein
MARCAVVWQSCHKTGLRQPLVVRMRLNSGGYVWCKRWPALCSLTGMSTLTFKVQRKSGTYVRPSLVPANHSAQTRFGAVDAVISAFFLGCVGGLIYLLLQI